MKKMNYYLLTILFFFLFFAGCTNKKVSENGNQQAVKNSTTSETMKKTAIPTLFIHGYSGGESSFGRMIKRMDRHAFTKKELVLIVSPTGKVQAQGNLTGTENNPSVQILFEDNKNNEWNQAEWIKNCLAYIHDKYGITDVNLVGHSMGGASSLRYLTKYGDDASLPKINKFVGIAAPFNNFVDLSKGESIEDVLNNGPKVQSERYTDYLSGIKKVSKDMKVMIIAGDIEDGSLSDGTVPVADALSVVSLLKAHGNDVQEKIFYGKSAQHSQLHENTEVDKCIIDFLWK